MNLPLDWGACASDGDLPVAEEKTSATVLTLAVKWAGPGLAKRLIQGGADVHARGADASIRNNKSETHLQTCFFRGSSYKPFDADAIATLLAHGAKVTNKDDNGNTPLHLASSCLNQVDAISLLLRQGANPAMRNSKLETPLHRAAGGSFCRVKDINRMTAEKTEAQENILAKLVEVGGTTLMDLPNAEGKSTK
ncbi:ankyrin repeat-containing domain protein [Fusarium sp. MPI-SDFR-AT-0072]|nr:ankyrin repeat-containing domain protein [Fusarium sp. MPI-SDFR-AT-0072]